jgi:hypothetical protein
MQIYSFGVPYLYTEVGLIIMSPGFCVQILTYSLVKSRNLLKLSDRRIFLFYSYAPSMIILVLRHDTHDRPAYVLQKFSPNRNVFTQNEACWFTTLVCKIIPFRRGPHDSAVLFLCLTHRVIHD